MKTIPIFRVRDMRASIEFYTQTLDFELKYAQDSADDWVVDLVNGEAEIQLPRVEGDQVFGFAINVAVENIDDLFAKYKARGLDASNKPDSPVHQSPINQSWGRREFYVTDLDGNTLRFGQVIENE